MVTMISLGVPTTQPLRSQPVMRTTTVLSGFPTSLSRICAALSHTSARGRLNTILESSPEVGTIGDSWLHWNVSSTSAP